jgi:hypothetical protein
MEIDVLEQIVITLIIGLMIGLQREMREHSKEYIQCWYKNICFDFSYMVSKCMSMKLI